MSGDETGQLRRLLEGAVGQDPAFVCPGCGGVRFVPCPSCGGSRKVFIEEEDRIHRCGECNENGLIWPSNQGELGVCKYTEGGYVWAFPYFCW